MKLTLPRNVSNLNEVTELARFVQVAFDDLDAAINGGISFGANISASQLDVTFLGADQDLTVSHGLGRAPSGFFVVGMNAPAIIYSSPTANTSEVIYLRCNVASTVAKVMVY